jgi:hypothetical protein
MPFILVVIQPLGANLMYIETSEVHEFHKSMVWAIRRVLAQKEGVDVMAVSWRRALYLARYILNKKYGGKGLARAVNFARQCEAAKPTIQYSRRLMKVYNNLDKRLDTIFSKQYVRKAPRLSNEDQPADWLMV